MLLRLATSRILLFGFFAATSRDLLFFFYNHHVVLLHEDINFATMSSTKSILLPLYNFFSGEIFGADKVVFCYNSVFYVLRHLRRCSDEVSSEISLFSVAFWTNYFLLHKVKAGLFLLHESIFYDILGEY
jgi:hypothetical protein